MNDGGSQTDGATAEESLRFLFSYIELITELSSHV